MAMLNNQRVVLIYIHIYLYLKKQLYRYNTSNIRHQHGDIQQRHACAWCSHPPNKNEWQEWKGKKHFNTKQARPVEPPSDPSVHHELNIMKLDPAQLSSRIKCIISLSKGFKRTQLDNPNKSSTSSTPPKPNAAAAFVMTHHCLVQKLLGEDRHLWDALSKWGAKWGAKQTHPEKIRQHSASDFSAGPFGIRQLRWPSQVGFLTIKKPFETTKISKYSSNKP